MLSCKNKSRPVSNLGMAQKPTPGAIVTAFGDGVNKGNHGVQL